MYRLFLLFSLTVCAKVPIDTRGVDTPRGWTVDKSSGDVTASKAFDEGKTLKVDSFDSEEGITTKAVMSASDAVENIKTNIEKFNKLVAINTALRNALKERQDKTCFIAKPLKQLEVRVHTRLSPLRAYEPPDDNKWPRITVDLGDGAGAFFGDDQGVKVIDGGVIVFSREFLPDPDKKNKKKEEEKYNYTSNHLQKIEVKLTDTDRGWVFVEFEEKFGRKLCEKRGVFNLGCKGKFRKGKKYHDEGNKVLIEKVEVLVKLVGDNNDRFYKIFDEEPKIELSSTVLHYSFTGFRQNSHWALHAYSSKCDGWSGDHDGSAFAKEVWGNIQKGIPITNDLFAANFSCVDQKLFPNLITPQNPSPDITIGEDREKWLTNNQPFAPPADSTDKEDCQPVTAESIADDASKTAVHPDCRLSIPDDLDDRSEENLDLLRNELQKHVSNGEESNAGMKEEFDDLSRSGCFYDKKLTDGIAVEIEGQYLFDVAGKYMTKGKFKEKFTEATITSKTVPLYINLGLDNRSYPLGSWSSSQDDGVIKFDDQQIDPNYTENFKVRDISFVDFNRGGNPEQLIDHVPIETGEWMNSCWTSFFCTQQDGNAVEIDVESGIVNIQRIALYLGGSDKPFYERKADNQQVNKETGVKGGLFTLNSVVNSWTDYNIKNNQAWNARRGDGCSDN